MHMQWMVTTEQNKYQLNFASYSALFVNNTTDTSHLLNPIIEYFQPRSKMKDLVTIEDFNNNRESVTHHDFTAFELSNQRVVDDTSLKSKSLIKAQLKNDFLNHIETNGYMLTINTLLDDLLQAINTDLPIKVKNFNVESFIKLLEIDFSTYKNNSNTNELLNKYKVTLQIITEHLQSICKNSPLLFFSFPELYLSPREQLVMKEYLINFSKNMQIFVITNSKHFISHDFFGNNYFFDGKQLFNEDLLNDLEWESPLEYEKTELEISVNSLIKNHLDILELSPSISNYMQADIIVFKSIELYVLVFILSKLKFKFQLNLDPKSIDKPVFNYVMDLYEKM